MGNERRQPKLKPEAVPPGKAKQTATTHTTQLGKHSMLKDTVFNSIDKNNNLVVEIRILFIFYSPSK